MVRARTFPMDSPTHSFYSAAIIDVRISICIKDDCIIEIFPLLARRMRINVDSELLKGKLDALSKQPGLRKERKSLLAAVHVGRLFLTRTIDGESTNTITKSHCILATGQLSTDIRST